MTRRRLGVVLVALALGAALLGPTTASSQSIEDKREEARQISDRLDELTARYERLQDRANSAETELAEVQDQIAQAEDRLQDTIDERDDRRAELQDYAVNAYLDGNDNSASVAFDSDDEEDVPVRLGYIASVSGNRQELIEQLNATEEDVELRVDELEAAEAEAESLIEEIDQARQEAEQAIAEQESLQSQVDAELDALIEEEQARQAAERRAAAEAAAREQAAQQVVDDGGSGGGAPVLPPPPPPASGADAAVAAARSRIGAPYQWGAAGPNSFDCSGLTMWAWGQAGRSLPHNSGAQYSATRRVSLAELQPGDLVFHGSPIHHVSIYSGGGMVIDAPRSGATVTERSMYTVGTPVGYGRP